MDIMNIEFALIDGIAVLTIIGAVALFVSVVVQLTKEFIPKVIPTKLYALGVSIVSSMIAAPCYFHSKGIKLTPLVFIGSFALGFFSAYVAINGWDSLKELKDRFMKKDL